MLDINSLREDADSAADVEAILDALAIPEGMMRRNAVAPLGPRLRAIASSILDKLPTPPFSTDLHVVTSGIASLEEDAEAMCAIADTLDALTAPDGMMRRSALAPLAARLGTIVQTINDVLAVLPSATREAALA
jgi:hypothetical protein